MTAAPKSYKQTVRAIRAKLDAKAAAPKFSCDADSLAEAQDNANRILLRWNAHDELVAALTLAERVLRNIEAYTVSEQAEAWKAARASLAKAAP